MFVAYSIVHTELTFVHWPFAGNPAPQARHLSETYVSRWLHDASRDSAPIGIDTVFGDVVHE